jgi:hypothetical protein
VRIAFAVFLFVHAAAHAVGFITVSGIAEIEDATGEPSVLLTGLERNSWAMRVMSLLWLVALAGLVVAGVGVLAEASWTTPTLVGATVLSVALCTVWYRDTPFGLLANAIVVAVMVIPAAADRVLAG